VRKKFPYSPASVRSGFVDAAEITGMPAFW